MCILVKLIHSQFIFNYRTTEISKPCELSPGGVVTIFWVSGITSSHCTLWLLKQVVLTANCMVIHQAVFGELSNPFQEAWISSSCLCNQFIQTASIFYWHTCRKVLHMVITQEASDAYQFTAYVQYLSYEVFNFALLGACHDEINWKLDNCLCQSVQKYHFSK